MDSVFKNFLDNDVGCEVLTLKNIRLHNKVTKVYFSILLWSRDQRLDYTIGCMPGPKDQIGRTAIDWYPKRILLNRIWRIGEGRLVQSHKKRGWVIHNAILSVEYFYWFRSNGTYLFLIPKTFMVSSYRRLLESSLTCKLGRLFERHEINCILSPC